jgi:hypothetical protein
LPLSSDPHSKAADCLLTTAHICEQKLSLNMLADKIKAQLPSGIIITCSGYLRQAI